MRMLGLALLICLPLRAGDRSPLQEAVRLFSSPNAGQRDAGSRLAEREVRRLLAPLLEAMERDDPEVRRRARRVILSLVPNPPRDEKPELSAELRRRVEAIAAARQQFVAMQQARLVRLRAADNLAKLDTETVRRLLAAGGVEAELFSGVLAVGPATIPGGYRIRKVAPRSAAARLGLQPGDLVLRVNGKPARSAAEMRAALGTNPDWTRLRVEVLRRRELVKLPASR